ncbi:DUF262 domain-containing protein [Convivina intestini]|uniref:DUF262 domain-containing protein n=1 Tax=Convivina intestini TaxID=1505726 RepID=UPI00200FA444|nr:DUF262 domain-containing protein [Convivina intestini]CAH1853993.1 hypothetical protein R078131_00895 [Convivina intestini]
MFSNLKSIKDFFEQVEGKLVVPEYQRAYNWDINGQVDRLWQDLFDFSMQDDKGNYFLGSVIINASVGEENLTLIDGQQRTTTLILLLKALLITVDELLTKISNDEDSRNLKSQLKDRKKELLKSLYHVDDDNIYDVVDGKIGFNQLAIKYKNISINETYPDELEKILHGTAVSDIENNVADIKYKRGDNRHTKFFNNFKFFVNKFDDLETTQVNAFAKSVLGKAQLIMITSFDTEEAIEIFNSLNSTGLPLADADIFSAKLYSYYDEDNREGFVQRWKKLMDLSDLLAREKIVNIDEILNQYMYLKRSQLQETSTTLPGVRKYFTDLHLELLKEGDVFVSELKELANKWIFSDKDKDNQYALKLLFKFNSNFKLFYAPYWYLKKNDSNITKLNYSLTLLKLFVLLSVTEAGYSSKDFKVFLFAENMRLGKNIETDEIIRDFEEHIADIFDPESIKTILMESFADSALVTLNEYLFSKENNLSQDFLLFDKEPDIEHILPSSGKDLSTIRTQAGFSSEDEFEAYKNSLGNKILLELNLNRKIGNAMLNEKINGSKTNLEDGYKNSKYPIAQSISKAHKDVWTKTDIEVATEKAANRIVEFIFDRFTDNDRNLSPEELMSMYKAGKVTIEN